jgi:NAD(P)-dependent dehydrogenase (short-subunit alcohol dehydrogenase family)
MELRDKAIVVTGGGNGIGRAMCERFAREQPRGVVVADIDDAATQQVASRIAAAGIDCVGKRCDVTIEAEVRSLIETAEERFGGIDLYCSNAGVTAKGGLHADDDAWRRNWEVNVMGHVYAARCVVPRMIERGAGYFLLTASAAGLLTEIGSAPYSVTKHGTVAFAEWLSVCYQRKGLRVSVLCPAGVATDFLDLEDPVHQFLHVSSLTPEQVAEDTLAAISRETFLILPHAEVAEFHAFKGQDYDRWLKNFARINQKLERIASKQSQAGSERE